MHWRPHKLKYSTNKRGVTLLLFLISLTTSIQAQGPAPQENGLLQRIASTIPDSNFQQVFHHPHKYRLQILYTEINRDQNNLPHFTSYRYHCSPENYFNPASTVKLPISLLSLGKLHSLKKYGVTKDSYMVTDSSFSGQQSAQVDSTTQSGYPSISSYIKRIFLVSDNDAYNRLYEFLGQKYINEKLHEKGYRHTRINRRFYPFNELENRHTNGIHFLLPNSYRVIYRQPPAYNTDSFHFGAPILIGKAHMDNNDSLIQGPYDFTRGNQTSLEDLTNMLRSVVFYEATPEKDHFHLSEADRAFLLQYMSQYPGETNYPKYDSSKFFDSFTKFFFRNNGHTLPSYIRVFNKPGWSYGFLTNIAYIVDFKNHIEFMLSCTLYVNEDGIVNDNKYDYDAVGIPFMTALGQAVYQYELHRKRPFAPDLSALQNIKYDHRDLNDTRPTVREVAD